MAQGSRLSPVFQAGQNQRGENDHLFLTYHLYRLLSYQRHKLNVPAFLGWSLFRLEEELWTARLRSDSLYPRVAHKRFPCIMRIESRATVRTAS